MTACGSTPANRLNGCDARGGINLRLERLTFLEGRPSLRQNCLVEALNVGQREGRYLRLVSRHPIETGGRSARNGVALRGCITSF